MEKNEDPNNPDDALHKGLAMVHQELQPIPERTIAENMYLGRYPMKMSDRSRSLTIRPCMKKQKMAAGC